MDQNLIEIIPHPFKPDERVFLMGIARKADADHGDKPIISVIGTDGAEDRHGSVLNPNGWDISSYQRNPVVLWSHQQNLPPIGRTIGLTKVGQRWEFDLDFATEEWDGNGGQNLARLVHRLMQNDYLRATSVSFIPKEWADRQAQTIPSFFAENVEYKRQELTEISPVSVPSNRGALKKAIADNVISENEATLLGLDQMLRLAVPIVVRSEPKPATRNCETHPAVTLENDRCGSCYAPTPPPAVTPEAQATEIETMNTLATQAIEHIATALDGWETAEHDELRYMCRNVVIDSLYTYDRLRSLAREWYGEDLADKPADLAEILVNESGEISKARSFAAREHVNDSVISTSNHLTVAEIDAIVSRAMLRNGEVRTVPIRRTEDGFDADALIRSATSVTGEGRLPVARTHTPATPNGSAPGDDDPIHQTNSYLRTILTQ